MTTETTTDTGTTTSTELLYYAYDASGLPLSVTLTDNNGTEITYYYATNLQGDVSAILTSSGSAVVEYTYDAWGNPLTTTGTLADTLGQSNSLRYRGYVFDQEMGYYYLQTRYYSPDLGRFINADIYASTGQGLLGNNMFAYCNNSPVLFSDASGTMMVMLDLANGGGGGGLSNGAVNPTNVTPAGSKERGAVKKFFKRIKDFFYNTDEQAVIDAKVFAFYKGKLVVKLPIGRDAFSFGFIGMGPEITDIQTVRHEYGHTQQMEKLGLVKYTFLIAIPSLTGNRLGRLDLLPFDYYSQPWEYQADQYGGVTDRTYESWAKDINDFYSSFTFTIRL